MQKKEPSKFEIKLQSSSPTGKSQARTSLTAKFKSKGS